MHEDQALYADHRTRPPVDPELMCAALGNRRVLIKKKAEAIGGTEFPEVEARRAREKCHKYFLPAMRDANFRRLRKSDPELFAFVGE